jgi:hypothetical protein
MSHVRDNRALRQPGISHRPSANDPASLPDFLRQRADGRAETALQQVADNLRRERSRREGFASRVVLAAAAIGIAGVGAVIVVGLNPFSASPGVRSAVTASAMPDEVPAMATIAAIEPAPATASTGAVMPSEAVEAPQPAPIPEPMVMASVRPAAPVPAAAMPVAAAVPVAPVEPPVALEPPAPVAAPPPVLKPAEIDALIAKGEQILKTGDLASARLFFERAANAGDARGALAMAQTYDPQFVRKLPVYGLAANQAEADRWYARARELKTGLARR